MGDFGGRTVRSGSCQRSRKKNKDGVTEELVPRELSRPLCMSGKSRLVFPHELRRAQFNSPHIHLVAPIFLALHSVQGMDKDKLLLLKSPENLDTDMS